MTHRSFDRLFAPELPNPSVDLLFLTQMTDLFFEAQENQILRMAMNSHDMHEAADLDEYDLDPEMPF